LVNTFEEPFGDICGKKGVWKKLSVKAASSIGRNVVALASFDGDFIMICHLLFHLSFLSQPADNQNLVQEKKGFLHARGFLLGGMDLQLF
jgi:hypothetical protein